MADPELVSVGVFAPANSIFKASRNERAECTSIRCTLPTCPLRSEKACMLTPIIGWTKCPYGTVSVEKGPTKRASGYWRWVSERRARAKPVGQLGYPSKKMRFVGDYVYLPYAFMAMNEGVPFLSHSSCFNSGTCLVPVAEWTLKTVVSMIDFHPRSLMGGVIVDYQKKEVPLFLLHLRESDPGMWKQLIEHRPELDTQPDHRGRKALLRSLNSPLKWTTSGGHKSEYPVTWTWDGTHVSTSSKHAYDSTWGDLRLGEFELRGKPSDDAEIVVLDNDWVGEDTVFTT